MSRPIIWRFYRCGVLLLCACGSNPTSDVSAKIELMTRLQPEADLTRVEVFLRGPGMHALIVEAEDLVPAGLSDAGTTPTYRLGTVVVAPGEWQLEVAYTLPSGRRIVDRHSRLFTRDTTIVLELTATSIDCTLDCSASICNGTECGEGLVCRSRRCLHPCLPSESTDALCGNGVDDDCDGAPDCADSECEHRRVGEYSERCCRGTRVNIARDPDHCGGCGIACAPGRTCRDVEGLPRVFACRCGDDLECAGDSRCSVDTDAMNVCLCDLSRLRACGSHDDGPACLRRGDRSFCIYEE